MTKLTDTQLVILSAAAQRQDLKILPLPKSLLVNKGTTTRVINGLIRKGLAVKVTATRDDKIWCDDGDKQFAVVITDKGLDAIGVVDEGSAPDADEIDSTKAGLPPTKSPARNPHRTEPRRVYRRLQLLRGWSNEADHSEIFTGSARACGADGA